MVHNSYSLPVVVTYFHAKGVAPLGLTRRAKMSFLHEKSVYLGFASFKLLFFLFILLLDGGTMFDDG
jgi:hypothetical protein